MASYQFINRSANNQVRYLRSGEVIRGRSKMLMCLHKILRIISSFPPPETLKGPSLSSVFDVLEPSMRALKGEDNRALFDTDLNLGADSLVSPPLVPEKSESTAENGGASACSGVVGELEEIDSPVLSAGFSTAEKSPVGECDLKEALNLFRRNTTEIEDGEEAEIVGEKAIDISEVTSMEVQCSKMNSDRVSAESIGKEESKVEEVTEEKHEPELHRSKGGLDLLVEAAKLISGEFEDGEPEPKPASRSPELSRKFSRKQTQGTTENETPISESARTGSKRRKQNECWMVDLYGDFEDVSPVVRSKRGRSQVLPYKYRDSVLEPLKPLSRHRSATVSTKRRSR